MQMLYEELQQDAQVAELLKNGEITKLSGGRYTAYLWSGEE